MAISAKRSSFLDQETNVGTASYGLAADSSVFNSPYNANAGNVEHLDDLINSAIQNKPTPTLTVGDITAEATRFTKDAQGRLVDLSKLPSEASAEFFKTLSGDNVALAKKLQGLAKSCSAGNGMGYGVPGKPIDASLSCGKDGFGVSGSSKGTSSSCNAASYSDLLNSLTGGGYGSIFKDLNNALKSFMALAGYGYKLGMCGVFGALAGSSSSILSNNELSKAAGSLLGSLGAGGNVLGFMDVAKGSAGLSPLLTNPGAIGGFFSNFTLPTGLKQCMYGDLGTSAMGAAELLDNDWTLSDTGSDLSIAELGDYNEDANTVLTASMMENGYAVEDLDAVASDDSYYAAVAYQENNKKGDWFDTFWDPVAQ